MNENDFAAEKEKRWEWRRFKKTGIAKSKLQQLYLEGKCLVLNQCVDSFLYGGSPYEEALACALECIIPQFIILQDIEARTEMVREVRYIFEGTTLKDMKSKLVQAAKNTEMAKTSGEKNETNKI
jgi:hypothetical protein